MGISDLFQPLMDNYDTQLMREGEDVCRVLDLPKHVRRVDWFDRILWYTYPSDGCGFGRITGYFSARMKGKLEPKEWRPIMCSRMIYLQLKQNPPLSVFFGWIATLFLGFIVGGGFAIGGIGMTIDSLVILALFLADVPIFILAYCRGTKRQKLQADLLASRVEGKHEFFLVLRKIQSLGLDDIVRTDSRGRRRYISTRPSVAERIHNLELFKG